MGKNIVPLSASLNDQTLQADITDCNHNKTAVKNKNPAPELLRNGADVNEQAVVASVRPKWLPEADCCKNFTYAFELERVKTISKRALQHQKHLESYVNPILKAREYESMLKEQNLTQSQLAVKLGISRVRVTQILNLLKLPQEQQNYIIEYGKEKQITERSLRKSNE